MPSRRHPPNPSSPTGQELEFGVPVPGTILPPEKWADSSLRAWPVTGYVDFELLFSRRAPVVLDLGCGNGRSVLLSALSRPGYDHLGVDSLPVVIRYARRRARQRGLANVRFAVGDAKSVLTRYIRPGSIVEIDIYHPQPYYDPRDVGRRLITPLFLSLVHRCLKSSGLLVLQTDNPAYWRYILQVVPAFFDFHEHPGPWPESPAGRTRREIIARQRGLPVFRGEGIARTDIDPDAARAIAETLPPPVFDADRRLMELDNLERRGSSCTRTRRPKPRKR